MLALEETFLSMCRSSGAIILCFNSKLSDRCFCYFTAAMFVSLRRTQTWRFHTKLYKFGWHNSANNAWMKNSSDLVLGKVVYIWIISRISDSWLFSLNGYDFYFDHMTGENRELNLWVYGNWHRHATQSSIIRLAWTSSLKYLSVKIPVVDEKRLVFRGWESAREII